MENFLILIGNKPLYELIRKMKITILLLMISIAGVYAVESYAQTTKLSLQVIDKPIKEVLLQVEGKSEFRFFYNENVKLDKKVSADLVNKTVFGILDEILDRTTIQYKVMGKQIALFNENESETADVFLQQQQRFVSGKVTDSSGASLPGVSVVVKGTTIGTITDANGNYSIKVPENATLQFSFIGMKTQEIAVSGKTTINVTMAEETVGIDEVVAIGYGTQTRKTLTGAVGTIRDENLTKRPAANTSELLIGQIPGLQTRQESGLPGSDNASINIRGFSNPLVMVDGIEGDLSLIDPNDIKSISVLKDASAAVYGARAGNGVILITTKRGDINKPKINYNGSVYFSQLTQQAEQVNAREFAELVVERKLNLNTFMPKYLSYDPEAKTLTNLVDGKPFEGYNWGKAMLRPWAPLQQHNINSSGGNDKTTYFVSLGYTDQESNFSVADYTLKRYNIRSNINSKITDNLSVALDFAYTNKILDRAHFGNNGLFQLLNFTRSARPFYPPVIEQDPTRSSYSGVAKRSPYFASQKEYSGFNLAKENTLQGNIEVNYNIPFINKLKASARLSFTNHYTNNRIASKPQEVYEYDPSAAGTAKEWIYWGSQGTNSISVNTVSSRDLLPSFSLNYENQFGDHQIKAMATWEYRTFIRNNVYAGRNNLLSFEAPYLNYGQIAGLWNSEDYIETGRMGIIGRLNYNFKSKYLFELTMRADASAQYPPESRWGYFPGLSAAWRISDESFIRDNFSFIENLKLRGSVGKMGFDAVSSFNYLTGYNISSNSMLFGTGAYPMISSRGLANPLITWETMNIYNVGLDAGFWKGLLGFELDVFYRLRENILAQPIASVPSTFGATLPLINLDKRDNRGFELLLTHKNTIGKFSYYFNPMISWARGKYIEVQENISTDPVYNNRYQLKGQWDDLIWGYKTDGTFLSQKEINEYPVNQDLNIGAVPNKQMMVGDLKYIDQNGDKIIDWRDEVPIGKSGLPKTNFGVSMGASYKNFSLDVLFQGATDLNTELAVGIGYPDQESNPLQVHYDNRAIVGGEPGDQYIINPDAKLLPLFAGGKTPNSLRMSDYWQLHVWYMKLKSFNLSYNLPKNLTAKIKLENATIYFAGSNLFTLSNLGIWKKVIDPEVTLNDGREFLPVKTIAFGIRITM